jgi:hypothetical protein
MENEPDYLDPIFSPKVDTTRRSRGGIRDYSEVTARGVQRVRGVFCSGTFDPRITITFKTITFSPSCVRFFPDCQHVTISIDEETRRLFVEPTADHDDNGLKFAHLEFVNRKNGKNVPRKCTTEFSQMLFNFMDWNPEAKYRIGATFQSLDNYIMLFKLDDAVQVP